jgi:hypothetical protein
MLSGKRKLSAAAALEVMASQMRACLDVEIEPNCFVAETTASGRRSKLELELKLIVFEFKL